jgi:hypothetical protein
MDASASAALMTNGQAHQQMSSSRQSINSREMNDLASDCNQWGRYNVHYLEPDGEQMTSAGSGNSINCVGSAPSSSPCPGDNSKRHQPLRPKVSTTSNEAQGGNGTTTRSIKRHGSDAGTRNKGMKNRNRVSRRQSEGPNGSAAVARTKMQQQQQQSQQSGQHSGSGSSGGGIIRLGSSTSCLEPCLRLSIIHRHESDLRKKRVAFSDAPVVVWNDPPVILFSPPTSSRQSVTNNSSSSSGLASYHRRHSYPSNSLLAGGDGDSGGFKDSAGSEEFQHNGGAGGGDEVLTPKERRRRKVVMAVVCTTFILLTASALFVLITLFNASAIDEAGTLFLNVQKLSKP